MPAVDPKPGLDLAGATLLSQLKTERLYSVWKARSESGPCAVYVVSPAADELERRRFGEAASTMAKLDDVPGVLRVREVGANGQAFSCELHDTGTAEHLPTLSWAVARRVEFLRTLCTILGRLHDRHIVHGCLRPSAILLGADLEPVLADITIADVTAELGLDEKDTMSFGRYASPEAATGGTLDARSDVFSLGRILHFLLVGFPPEAVVEPIPRLDTMAVVPTGLTRIVRKCVSEDPATRYASTADLAADLAKYKEAATTVGTVHPDEGRGQPPRSMSTPTATARISIPQSRPSSGGEGPMSRARPTPGGPRPAPSVRTPDADTRSADDFPLTTRRAGAIGGSALAIVALGLAYAGAFPGVLRYVGLVLVAAGFGAATLAIPVDAAAPKTRRIIYAAVVALIFAIIDPGARLTEIADAAKIAKGGGATNASGVMSAVSHGRKDFIEVDLKGADLAGANLSGLSFDRADLTDAKLAGANLAWTTVAGANLSGADLSGVDGGAIIALPYATCSPTTKPPTGWICTAGKFARIKLRPYVVARHARAAAVGTPTASKPGSTTPSMADSATARVADTDGKPSRAKPSPGSAEFSSMSDRMLAASSSGNQCPTALLASTPTNRDARCAQPARAWTTSSVRIVFSADAMNGLSVARTASPRRTVAIVSFRHDIATRCSVVCSAEEAPA